MKTNGKRKFKDIEQAHDDVELAMSMFDQLGFDEKHALLDPTFSQISRLYKDIGK